MDSVFLAALVKTCVIRADLSADIAGENPAAAMVVGNGTLPARFLVNRCPMKSMLRT
jgi:hypothetical protein